MTQAVPPIIVHVKEHKTLGSGAILDANDERVTITLSAGSLHYYTALSSAVLNGGIFQSSKEEAQKDSTSVANSIASNNSTMHILNAKVPADYDGVTPDPQELLRRMASTNESFESKSVVGLLTAASMRTLSIASRSADGVYVDAIVTAGISNSRRVGADADFMGGLGGGSTAPLPPGTINTIVVTNASLTPAALVESHAICMEAKCAANANMGIVCAKSGEPAQGTGTDATVVVSKDKKKCVDESHRIPYAGKHTLFAELLGQAVLQATEEALLINIDYIYGGRWRYALHKCRKKIIRLLLHGSRPDIPPAPMMPVPAAPISILLIGYMGVLLAYMVPYLPQSARILLAAVVWDRYLSMPLMIHPVVLVGRLISFILTCLPKSAYTSSAFGFLAGWILLISVVGISIGTAGALLRGSQFAATFLIQQSEVSSSTLLVSMVQTLCDFAVWLLQVLLLNSSSTLQLLCTLALQMARLLERRQIPQARAQLSWLCSRDPSNLNSSDLAGGTLESLSENLSDSFVAPLFWYLCFGPLGALGYRTINTLDSRVGYHGKYEWIGKPSARLDDVINLIPARMTAVLLLVAAMGVRGCSARNGWTVAWKDAFQCESPNAGWPMGAMAGLLGVVLEKKGEYSLGKTLSEEAASPRSIRLGHQVAQSAGYLAALIAFVGCLILPRK